MKFHILIFHSFYLPPASNSFASDHKESEPLYLKPPGSAYHPSYPHHQQQSIQHHSTPRPDLRQHTTYENYAHQSNDQQSYHRQQIYQQPYQQVHEPKQQQYSHNLRPLHHLIKMALVEDTVFVHSATYAAIYKQRSYVL